MPQDLDTSTSMTRVAIEPEGWRSLCSLRQRKLEDRQHLSHLLEAWCSERGSTVAALYRECRDGEYRLQVKTEEGEFPRRWCPESDDSKLRGGRTSLKLPSGLLVHESTSKPPSAEEPTLLMLAAGARISYLKELVQEQRFQASIRGVELEALYDVGLAVASTLDLDKLGEEVLLRAVSLIDARRGALYLLQEGSFRLNRTIGGRARESFDLEQFDLNDLTSGLDDDDDGVLPGARYLQAVRVEIDGDPRGLLVVGDKESRRGVGPFRESDVRTLQLFANQAAIALENAKLHRLALEKERLEREMELAAEIQQQILPKEMPTIPGFEVLGWNRPALQVGGDYFDLRPVGAEDWTLVVGDVSGKGLPAALLVSTLHSALRLMNDRMEVGAELVERLSQHVHESSSANRFITLILAELCPDSSRLRYVNAGHNPGLVMSAGGGAEELGSSGLPLGLMPNARYRLAEVTLEPGDLVCLYSDGITECESPSGEEYGQDRLVSFLGEARDRPLAEIIQDLDLAMLRHARGCLQGDDQTVVLLRRRDSN